VNNTPTQAGFYMPAEWEVHEGTWLQWPHNNTYPDHQLRLEHIWLAMTEALHEHETVHIVASDQRGGEHLQHLISYYGLDESRIDIHTIPTDDVWSRDSGPIFLVDGEGELAVTEWNFNGWGGRYPCDKDRLVPAEIARIQSVPLFTGPIVLEGGAIDVNGQGTLIACRTSIINPNRNPGKSQTEIEGALQQYLGVRRVIWLSGAPRDFCDSVGDDTDFHVDLAARFVDESTVLYSWTDDRSHPFYPYLVRHREELEQATTESGEPLALLPLPLPQMRLYAIGDASTRPPFETKSALASYTNFYVANGVVLVPVYGDINDAGAKSILAEHFPERRMVGIPAHAVAELGGMMHCITQQQPDV
jgi:agmatine deiminase